MDSGAVTRSAAEDWATCNLPADLADLLGQDLAPSHPHAPLRAFLRAVGGVRGGWSDVERVVAEPTDTIDRAAEVVVLRLWHSLQERRPDDAALSLAEALLVAVPLPSVERRALLHLNIAATLQEGLKSFDPDVWRRIDLHLARALALGQLTGMVRVSVAAQSRLALMAMLRGQVPTAEHLAAAARRTRGESASDRTEAWEYRVVAVEQWVLHCRNQSVDLGRIKELHSRMATLGHSALSRAVLASAYCLAAIDELGMSATRRLLDVLVCDAGVEAAGVWQLMLDLLDGYLAISSDDGRRREQAVASLRRVGAEAEARLLEATALARSRDYRGAADLLDDVTSERVPSLSITYPSACVIQGVAYHRNGQLEEARRCLTRAVADTQRTGVLRTFTIHEPGVIREILGGLQIDNAATADWVREIRRAVDAAEASEVFQTTTVPLPTADGAASAVVSPLTARELDVLRLVASGHNHQWVAHELHISLNTVKTHLRSLRHKLDVARTGEAVAVALAARWIDVQG